MPFAEVLRMKAFTEVTYTEAEKMSGVKKGVTGLQNYCEKEKTL